MEYVLFAIVAYLLGSIPSALIVGKLGYNIDIREHGSGNLGGTNTFRVLGIKAGIIVTLADILKGTLATLIPLFFDADVYPLAIGIFAVIGHTYPIFARFKGGKAVATSGGIVLGVNPILFVVMILTFLLTLKISKLVHREPSNRRVKHDAIENVSVIGMTRPSTLYMNCLKRAPPISDASSACWTIARNVSDGRSRIRQS